MDSAASRSPRLYDFPFAILLELQVAPEMFERERQFFTDGRGVDSNVLEAVGPLEVFSATHPLEIVQNLSGASVL
ncbi:conserved hypothetical protein [Ricinus communis]|uniref:Uncharacterized protein n=1 Tax=Ricinus communis TaxID=3988 RepID=B9SNN1_RICCO|nr:conserved hypothetical protein [Ricinus communis]